MLKFPEAAEYLECGISFIKKLRRDGRIPVVKLAKRAVRIRRDDLDRLIEECTVTAPNRGRKRS